MNLIVSVAIILLNLYVAYGISCQIPHVVLSIYFPDVSTSICVEADPKECGLYPLCHTLGIRIDMLTKFFA